MRSTRVGEPVEEQRQVMSKASSQDAHRKTVAIVGDSPVVCRAIARLVERGGFRTRVLDTMREEPDEAEVDVVLVTAGITPACLRSFSCLHAIPILKLVDAPIQEEDPQDKSLLWPCAIGELHSALARASAAGLR